MARRLLVAVLLGWFWVGWGWVRTAYAADARPIEQLPKDVVRWSTLWTHVPRQIVTVSQAEGALSGLTWGATKGTVTMMQAATEEMWNAVKPNERPRRGPWRPEPFGVILRYEF